MPGYSDSLRDVQRYTTAQLKRHEHGEEVYATYRQVWDDAFGARGWKLNAAIPIFGSDLRKLLNT